MSNKTRPPEAVEWLMASMAPARPLAIAATVLSLVSAVIAGRQLTPPAVVPETGTIAGRVTSAHNGSPRSAAVYARIQGVGPVHEVRAFGDGYFRFVVPAGHYVLHASVGGGSYVRRGEVEVPPSRTVAVELLAGSGTLCECTYVVAPPGLQPPPPAAVAGRVTDLEGNPIPLAEISLRMAGSGGDDYLTGPSGQFATSVPADILSTIIVRYPGLADARVDLRLKSGESRMVRIVLKPGSTGQTEPATRSWDFGCRCGQGWFKHPLAHQANPPSPHRQITRSPNLNS